MHCVSAFEPLIGQTQVALTTMEGVNRDSSFNARQVRGFPLFSLNANADQATTSFNDFLVELNRQLTFVSTTFTVTTSLRNQISSASISISPYSPNVFTSLVDAVREIQTKAVECLNNVRIASQAASVRLTLEVIPDIELFIGQLGEANGRLAVRAIVADALDELVEAKPDLGAQLDSIAVSSRECVSAITVNQDKLREQLTNIGNPSPPFSDFLAQFAAA